MKVHRAIINPQTRADLNVRLPERFLQTETEIIAFSVEEEIEPNRRDKKNYLFFESSRQRRQLDRKTTDFRHSCLLLPVPAFLLAKAKAQISPIMQGISSFMLDAKKIMRVRIL